MGDIAARGFPADGIFAIFEEPNTTGLVHDIDAARNAPAKTPASYLDKVRFHVDFDYYQVSVGPSTVTVNHASVAGASTNVVNFWGGASGVVTRVGQIVTTYHDLVTHSLSYIPKFMVIADGHIIAPGTMVQSATAQERTVTPFATTSKIRLMDIGISSGSALSAMSKDYTVLVFKQPAETSDQLMSFDPDTGQVILGLGKFDSDIKMLRQSGAGDSPFDISLGPTVGIRNGVAKTVLADGTTVTESGYTGSFAGSGSIQCAVQ
jgi:hypothetical protein